MSSNAPYHLLEELVHNCPIPNPPTMNFSMTPKKSTSTLAQTQPTTPQILVKLSSQPEIVEGTDAEKDVAKKGPSIRLQLPNYNPENNATIAIVRPINPTGANWNLTTPVSLNSQNNWNLTPVSPNGPNNWNIATLVSPNSMIPVKLISRINRRTKRVPAVKSAVHDDSKISPF